MSFGPARRRLMGLAAVTLGALVGLPTGARAESVQPQAGDWEASGISLSFVVNSARAHGERGSTIADFAGALPERCSADGKIYASPRTEGLVRAIRVSPTGSVRTEQGVGPSVTTVSGTFTGADTARLRVRSVLNLPTLGATPATHCATGNLALVFRHAHRRTVRDGLWRGHSASGQPVTFQVSDGGRLVETRFFTATRPPGSFLFGRFSVACAGGGCTISGVGACTGSIDPSVFITAAGEFDSGLQTPTGPVATGVFPTPDAAQGTWSDPTAPTCDSTWTATG
jgi:hypothetical protein